MKKQTIPFADRPYIIRLIQKPADKDSKGLDLTWERLDYQQANKIFREQLADRATHAGIIRYSKIHCVITLYDKGGKIDRRVTIANKLMP